MTEADGSAQLPAATAVEVVREPAPVGFVHGIAAGVALAVVIVQAFLSYELGSMRDMYRDFGSAIPMATRVVVSGAWRWGVPVAGAVLVSALIAFRPKSVWAYIAFALVMTAVAITTWCIARMPIYELAGNISAE